MESVWIVSYYDSGEDPVVTSFDNKDAAMRCYEHFVGEHEKVDVDEVPIYHSFVIKD